MAARRAPMPESVKIGPFDYRVSTDVSEHRQAEERTGLDIHGQSQGTRGLIIISPHHVEGYQRSTMIHEIIHQVFMVSGAVLEDDAEERICRHLETGLLGVLRDNPDLVRWLTA